MRKPMNRIIKPITPAQVIKNRISVIPEIVIESFNELLLEKWDGKCAIILQSDIIERIISKDASITRQLIYDKKWLDIEPIFMKVGWLVSYDSSAWDESCEARFRFKL